MYSAGSFAEGRLVASNGIYGTDGVDRAAKNRSSGLRRSGAGRPMGSYRRLGVDRRAGRAGMRVRRGMSGHKVSAGRLTAGDRMNDYGRSRSSYGCVLVSRHAESQNEKE